MSSLGMSEMGANPKVIDDSNASFFVREIKDPSKPGVFGAFDADQVQHGFGSPYSREIMPPAHWDEHIKRQEAEQSSPDHWRIANGVPVLNQGSFGYCWMYGVGGAMNTAYAQTNIKNLRLNPFMTAWIGKNGRNQGGWGGEGLGYNANTGMPTQDVWPESVKNGSLVGNHEVELSANMHKDVKFEELPRNDFEALMSALLDPERPCPVTMGLNWWGHLIYAVKAVKISSGNYGVKIVNSWKPSWGEKGTAVLAKSKATAFEQIAITHVQPRVAP